MEITAKYCVDPDENCIFELPDMFVDKGKDAVKVEQEKIAFDLALRELVQGQAKDLQASICNVISLYHEHFFPYLPYNMVLFKNYIVDNFKRSYVSIVDLSKVFSIVKMVSVVGTNAQLVSDFMVPHRQTTVQMTDDIANNLCLMSENGMQYVQGGNGEYAIDYIVPKHDGNIVYSFKVMCNNLVKHHLFVGRDVTLIDNSLHVFVAEMYNHDIIMFYGYDQFEFPATIKINLIEYTVKYNMPITIEHFLTLNTVGATDGYIFGINGIEYKVKYENTIDIVYRGGVSVKLLGDNYIVCNRPDIVSCNIHEMVMRANQLVYLRPRPDKCVGQSSVEVLALQAAPTVNYVRSLLSNIKGPCYGSYHDVKPNNIIASEICDYLIRDERSKVSVINTFVVKTIASRLGIVTTSQDLKHILRALGCQTTRLEKRTRSQLLQLQFPIERHASRSDIYKLLLDTKLVLTPIELVRQLAMRGYTTSLKRVNLMMLHCELRVLGSRVMAVRVCGRFLPFCDKRPPRVLCQYDDLTFIRGLTIYAKLNAGAHVLDTEIMNLKSECDELFEHYRVTDVALHQEIGDVVMMITKVALRVYAPRSVIEDEHAFIWQLMSSLNIMQPFKQKCMDRISKYGCVRNHLTCGSHICSNGKEFVKPTNEDISVGDLPSAQIGKVIEMVKLKTYAQTVVDGKDKPPFGAYVQLPPGSLGPYDRLPEYDSEGSYGDPDSEHENSECEDMDLID